MKIIVWSLVMGLACAVWAADQTATKEIKVDKPAVKVLSAGSVFWGKEKRLTVEIVVGIDAGHQLTMRLYQNQLDAGKEYTDKDLPEWNAKWDENQGFMRDEKRGTFTKVRVLKLDPRSRIVVFGAWCKLWQPTFSADEIYLYLPPLKVTVEGQFFDDMTKLRK